MRIAILALLMACGDKNGDDTSTNDAMQPEECEELEAMCGYCTLPGLEDFCNIAVDSNNAEACQDGLDDSDVQTDCVP